MEAMSRPGSEKVRRNARIGSVMEWEFLSLSSRIRIRFAADRKHQNSKANDMREYRLMAVIAQVRAHLGNLGKSHAGLMTV